jgi:hypothetical protein
MGDGDGKVVRPDLYVDYQGTVSLRGRAASSPLHTTPI